MGTSCSEPPEMKVVCRDGDEDDDDLGNHYDVDRDEEAAPVFRFLRAKPKMEDTRL